VAAPVASRAAQTALVPAVSRDDLAGLEQRLRAVETARVQTASARPSVSTVDDAALLRQVEALIAASERQEEDISVIVNAIRTLDRQQRVDLRQVEDRLGETQAEVGRTNSALKIMATSFGGGN
jgi:hypothetical protein